MSQPASFSAHSYAKINLCLHVTGKRPDGFHNIYSLFCAISLHDTLTIELAESSSIVSTGIAAPTGDDNIVMAVDAILCKDYGLTKHFKLTIDKHIPIGAGLGGGSSNACTYLELVNEAASLGLTREQMRNILSQVGSDAAFFLYRPFAIGEGRGELLTSVNIEAKLHFVLINPHIFISAASAYKDTNLILTSEADLPKMPNFNRLDNILTLMANDLERPIFAKYPLLVELCRALEAAGAAKAMMSGSGSTVFGIFKDSIAQEAAYTELSRRYPEYLVIKAESI
jgi:4-diphosphocytidyl-2-C-methyl-D-erythritol kinase